MRIALIGTRGVPARYGGFETAVEEVGTRLVRRGHKVVVFCRGAEGGPESYLGMELVHLPALKRRATETLSHTALSVLHPAARGSQAAIVFNAANALLVPVLRSAGVPTAVHVDGLEWKRSKWSGVGRAYYQASERLAVRWADELIADAVGIQDYYRSRYGAMSTFIPYGAPILEDPNLARLAEVGLSAGAYHLVVARFEPENNVHLALDAYASSRAALPLVVVGSAPYEVDYQRRLTAAGADQGDVLMLGALWDQELLDALYAGARLYVHGHSVGGTNPSLLRAMGAGAAVAAFDVVFNREVLGDHGCFWSDAIELAGIMEAAEAEEGSFLEMGLRAQSRAKEDYRWDAVADDYEALCRRLVSRRKGPIRP